MYVCIKYTYNMKIVDLIGKKFGRLKVIKLTGTSRGGSKEWECQCECGNICNITTRHLNRAKFNIKSCGCLGDEMRHRKGINHPDWKGIGEISQTFLTQHVYKKICANRKNLPQDVDNNYLWDLYLKQNKKCALSGLGISFPRKFDDTLWTASLDRIDSSIGYMKGNVQWVHKHVNLMKNIYEQNYFINMCKLIANNCDYET